MRDGIGLESIAGVECESGLAPGEMAHLLFLEE